MSIVARSPLQTSRRTCTTEGCAGSKTSGEWPPDRYGLPRHVRLGRRSARQRNMGFAREQMQAFGERLMPILRQKSVSSSPASPDLRGAQRRRGIGPRGS